MNDRQIDYIIAIAKEGSISEAARKLYVSQSSMSQLLKSVEDECGVRLFERKSGKRVTLTYAGEKYISALQEIRQIERGIKKTIQGIKESTAGKLTLGLATGYSMDVLTHVLPQFMEKYPKVELDIVRIKSQLLEERLLERTVDLAIIFYSILNSEISYIPLASEKLVIICPSTHRLAQEYPSNMGQKKSSEISLQEIIDEPFIQLSQGLWLRDWIDDVFLAFGKKPKKAMDANDLIMICTLVEAGLGNAIVPESYLRYDPLCRNLSYFYVKDIDTRRKIAVCHRSDSYVTQYMKDMIDLIKAWNYGD